jgi:hypothetical protein
MKRKLLRGFLIALSTILVMVGMSAAATPSGSWGNPVDPHLIQPSTPQAWDRPLSELMAAESVFPSMASANPLEPNCRIGINAWGDQLRDFNLIENFGTGVYFNYGSADSTAAMARAEHIGLVMVFQPRPGENKPIDQPRVCDGTYTQYVFSPPLTDGAGTLGDRVRQNPGKLWFLGNEPDRRATDGSDICPQQYADAYHDFYHFVKAIDPTAQVGVAGLVQVSPGRLQYRDIVWDTYVAKYGTPMPVDVWNMHIYLLSETSNGDAHIAVGTDPALRIPFSHQCGIPGTFCSANHDNIDHFAAQVVAMRRWMNERGERNKPLVLSEFGINLPYNYGGTCTDTVCPANPPQDYPCFCDTNGQTFHPQRVANFLRDSMNYLLSAKNASLGYPADDNRLVQQWIWFSAEHNGPGSASNLFRSTGSSYVLTQPGQALREFASAIPLQVNLLPTSTRAPSRSSADGTSAVTATLYAEIRNNGTKALDQPFKVTFYANSDRTIVIDQVTVPGLGGCARTGVTVQVEWPNRPTGVHSYWVVVNPDNAIAESSTADNVLRGQFIANPTGTLYLPLTRRR